MTRFVALALLAAAAASLAGGAAQAQTKPAYAGFEQRAIKTLSAEQIDDLRAGRGMGLALAAELNGYPGPAHVLELAEALHLTPAQTEATRALHRRMRDEAIALGERLIAGEAELDRAFARRASEAELSRLTAAAAEAQGALRFAHLRTHLEQAALLSPEQTARYQELRGYRSAAPGPQPGRRHRH